MAAFASLVCLSNLMVQVQNHPRFSTFFDKNQIQYLVQLVEFLLDFVERYNSHGGTTKEEVSDLEKQIASAAYAAITLTENYLEDQIVAGSSEQKRITYLLDLHKLMVDMGSIKEKVVGVKQNKQPAYSMIAAPPKPLTSGKPTMVGFDEELIQLMDLLTRQSSGRTIIPIVGMGGIGKTTLARNAFEHLLIKQNFDLCLWATASQEYSVIGILLQLLSFMQGKFTGKSVHELGEQLYKSLCGRRYLVVLDDMWNIDVWDKIKIFFPNNAKRSAFAITTRLSKVAAHFNSCCIMMKFLDEDKSWKLLREKAFREEDYPDELEEIGKEIVKKCKGLPLSIVVIGGHLRNSSMSKECWLDVANDINSVLDSGEDVQCLSILNLSYSHLPAYLKPCFLYIGAFLEGKKIRVSELVKLWGAEGFLKQSEVQSLEEVAEAYLNDLVDRNLILVHERRRRNGRIMICNIHDLLKDLCVVIAEKEGFHRSSKIQLLETIRIEDELGVVYPGSKFQQVCSRYLKSKIRFSTSYYSRPIPCLFLHSSVFLLWNLQTLIIDAKENVRIVAPCEIWEMPQLRHLSIMPTCCLPDPSSSDHQLDDLVLHNLQALLVAENLRLSEVVCRRIPNIKRLKLFYDGEGSSSSYYCLHNLCCFKQLKSLTCYFNEMLKWSDSALNLPSSLCKLSLSSRHLDWEDLSMIATMVPHLEALELRFWDSVIGQFEGEFRCLKSLIIYSDGDFSKWNAEKSHFPVLHNLTLIRFRLDEIPPGIVEIPTLGKIELLECNASSAVSAVKVVMEQEELGEEGFELFLDFENAYDEGIFWELVEREDLGSNNVVVNESFRTNTTIRMKSRA